MQLKIHKFKFLQNLYAGFARHVPVRPSARPAADHTPKHLRVKLAVSVNCLAYRNELHTSLIALIILVVVYLLSLSCHVESQCGNLFIIYSEHSDFTNTSLTHQWVVMNAVVDQ